MIVQFIASCALLFGAWMGGYSMLKPDWGSRVVGLVPKDGHFEGASEFRATFGGLFLFSHLVSVIALWMLDQMVAPIICIPLSAAWFGASFGRILSIFLDVGTRTKQNMIWVAMEFSMGLVIGLPMFLLLIDVIRLG